ncbi:MAG: FAD-binding oxidoreductase [Firmicutes bacterium]|nr:FAD-binding oxidoreductase [Bacillota bacterium]
MPAAVFINTPHVETVAFSDNPDVIENYLSDESASMHGKAFRVFFPADEAETAAVVKWANDTGTPLSVSGGGTGITGSRVPISGAVLSTEKLVHVREESCKNGEIVKYTSLSGEISFCIDELNDTAILPPGISLGDLYAVIGPRHLNYPPNPTELSAWIGGNVSTNASGGRSFRHGSVRKWVRRLRVILPTGELLEIKRGEHFADDTGHFAIEYPNGRILTIPIPAYEMPSVKNASGLYAKPGMDLIDLFIGCEGILGVFTEIELQLVRWNGEIFSCISFFGTEKDAVDFIKEARNLSRNGSSIFDALTIDYFCGNSLEFMRPANPGIPPEAGAAVFTEQFIPEDPEEIMTAWAELMEKHNCIKDWSATDAHDRSRLRDFRHSLPEAVNELMRSRGTGKMGLDIAVPDEKLEEIMEIYRLSAQDANADYLCFGHIGDNNLHMNYLPKNREEAEMLRPVYLKTAKKGIAMGGTISAEHGVGKKSYRENGITYPYLHLMYGEKGLKSIAEIKKLLDPESLLNRGNIIPEAYLL